ncbi:MAG: PocR ligand-binding domain-containing protein [Clostridia bacterium]|nr:PocR ligand-binding domain-containing protein [Clostridia bacterium]
MNKQEIVSVLEELNKITGFRVSLHDVDYCEIAAYPEDQTPYCKAVKQTDTERTRCAVCDREACLIALDKKATHIYKCPFGLTEAVSPLYNFGTLTGFLMMGQVATGSSDIMHARTELSALLGSGDEADKRAETIPIVDKDMLRSYVKIMTICAQYLTLSNAISTPKPTVAEMAKRYIGDNISKKFGISDICAYLGCSKSTLLTTFKKRYGITVNAYVTELRLEKAKHLLAKGEKTINEIASDIGFTDQSYFSKVFSQKFGTPPSEYRTLLLREHTDI